MSAAAHAEAGAGCDQQAADDVLAHVAMIHDLARRAGKPGKLLVARFGEDPETGEKCSPLVRHFEIGDVAGMLDAIRKLVQERDRNLYIPLAVMRPDLEPGKKGSERDVATVLGLVGDFDDDAAADYEARLPLPPSLVLETSAGRFQAAYLLDEPATVEDAKPVAEALKGYAGCDHGTADLSHVWRIPGTLNWPTKRKVDAGRPREPQPVRVAVPWDGSFIRLADLREALGALPRDDPAGASRAHGDGPEQTNAGAANGAEDFTLLLMTLPEGLRRKITEPTPEGERSEAIYFVVRALLERNIPPDRIERLIRAYPRGIGEKYVGRNDLDKEIGRIRADHGRGRAAPPEDDDWDTPNGAPPRVVLSDWDADLFAGTPEPVEWLTEGAIPLGVPGLVAAMGDIGKSYLLLDLALRIAAGEGTNLINPRPILGGRVLARGTAIILTAEDTRRTVHRRLDMLDPQGRRFRYPGKLKVVPLPDAGGPMPFVTATRDGPQATDAFKQVRDQLLRIEDLRLVVIDPLQAFVHADINADPMAAQFLCSLLANLCSATSATTLASHHMRKPSNQRPVTTPGEAREAVRGTTALIDGMRVAYALWPVDDEGEARGVCRRLGAEWQPNRVVRGAVVKANEVATRTVQTYVREEFGLLVDRTGELTLSTPGGPEDQEAMIHAVSRAVDYGLPLTKTGKNGVFARRSEFPEPLKSMSRHALERIADHLLRAGKIVQARIHGAGNTVQWLDVPGGAVARGAFAFAAGAGNSGTPSK